MANKQVIKQVAATDIGMKTFYACYKVRNSDGSTTIKGIKPFDNTGRG